MTNTLAATDKYAARKLRPSPIGMFSRPSAYATDGFKKSGADFLARYKEYILDGKTVIASPHKVYGPEQKAPSEKRRWQ